LKKNKYLVINSNMNKDSKSLFITDLIIKKINEKNDSKINSDLILLSQFDIPLCNGNNHLNNKTVLDLNHKINQSDGILIFTPIYNYNINSALKNLIEMTGNAWKEKILAFVCIAGGEKSYMSVMSLANSLMLDHRCVIIPRFVYVTGTDFISDSKLNDNIMTRINGLVDDLIKFVKSLT
tara:strand:+ start:8552 stop:9091 length:540 start_codon:yes stop_codon:yes gene_type:complete